MEIVHIVKYVLGICSLFLIITLIVSYLLYRIRRHPVDVNSVNNTPHYNTIPAEVTPENYTWYSINNSSYPLQKYKLLKRLPLANGHNGNGFNANGYNANGYNGNGHNGNGHNGNGHNSCRIESRFRVVNKTMPERPNNFLYFVPEETKVSESWVWETALEKVLKSDIRS